MLITYYSTPRQVGKTNLAMYEAIKNPDSIFLAFNGMYARDIADRHTHLKTMSYQQFFRDGRVKNFKTLVLDEYHYASLTEREQLHAYVLSRKQELDNVFVFTTPRLQMPQDMYDYIATCKAADLSLEQAINIKHVRSLKPKWFLLPLDYSALQVMIHELWFDLLFLDCSRHTIGNLKINFYDGDSRFPFFNYRTARENKEWMENLGDYAQGEITGQFIVK